jgi:tRNA-2-methylthio-N6-dimethylallyladenosine synthase
LETLVQLVQTHAQRRAERFVGRTVEVLVEGPSRTDPDRLRGRSRHNKVVNFSGLAEPGDLAEVEIASATSQTLAGEETLLARAAS